MSIYTAAADTGDGAEGGTTTEGDEHLLGAGNTRAWGLAVQAELGQVLSVEATSNRDGDQSRATEGGGVYFVHRCC